MPQIFQVLRCYKCSVFQVHQTRKDNKWVCKLCGEKQSVKRHYGLGTGKDCRMHVQKLNIMRGDKEENSASIVDSEDSEYDENTDSNTKHDCDITNNVKLESKWSEYIDKGEQNIVNNEPTFLDKSEVVLDIPRKRKMNKKFQQKKFRKNSVDSEQSNEQDVSNLEGQSCLTIRSPVKNYFIENIETETYKPSVILKSTNSKLYSNVINQNKRQQVQQKILNKESKWAKFVDNEGEGENVDNNTEKNCIKQPLFSLCDDSEIDTILDL